MTLLYFSTWFFWLDVLLNPRDWPQRHLSQQARTAVGVGATMLGLVFFVAAVVVALVD